MDPLPVFSMGVKKKRKNRRNVEIPVGIKMKGKNREHVLRAKDSRIEIPPFVIRTWFIIPFPINPVVANMMRRIGGSHKEAKTILVNMSNSLRTKSNSYGKCNTRSENS